MDEFRRPAEEFADEAKDSINDFKQRMIDKLDQFEDELSHKVAPEEETAEEQ